jgi:hypothetical protein
MDFVTKCLMHTISKCKEIEPHGNNVAMVLQQNKGQLHFMQGTKSCFYNEKHATLYIFATKQRTRSTKMCNGAYSNSVCKWIMDLEATKHMALHKTHSTNMK